MKPTKILALFASLAFASSALAQTTIISGAIQNGDLEAGVVAPWEGNAGTISTGIIADHTTGTLAGSCVEVDLTGNNGNAQWKGITDNASGSIPADDDVITHGLWVYVPAATEFPDGVNGNNAGGLDTNDRNTAALLVINLQRSLDGGASFQNGTSAYGSLNLKNVARDTWLQLQVTSGTTEAGSTHLRVNHNFQNDVNIGPVGGLVASDGGADGTDLPGPATPSDWNASGYSGVIYLDDFVLTTVAAPTPPPTGTLICDEFGNGDFEALALSPWNIENGAGSISTTTVNNGVQSLEIDLTAPGDAGNTGNSFRGFGLTSSMPATAGDQIATSIWVYIPTATQFGTTNDVNTRLGLEVRSDNGAGGNGLGNLAGSVGQRLDQLDRDEWINLTSVSIAVDDVNPITSINTAGWHLRTPKNPVGDGTDQAGLGFSGSVFLDDAKLMNLGPVVTDPEGTLVGPNTNNGTLEGSALPAPWGGPVLAPWLFSGAGTLSTAQDHTTGSGNSVCVDLTINNSNSRWKGTKSSTTGIDLVANDYNRVDISAWVYVPAGTTFGGLLTTPAKALLNFPIRDGGAAMPGGPSLDLTGVTPDVWVQVSGVGIDISAFTTSLEINNWNLETTDTLDDGVGGPLAADDDGTMPQDWIDNGYNGVFYMDDVSVFAYSVFTGPPIVVNSITYDGADVVINYDTSFDEEGFEGVDIYYSTDLVNWTADVFVSAVGDGLEVTRPSGDTARYYILVEPGQTPNFGNFPAPPITEG